MQLRFDGRRLRPDTKAGSHGRALPEGATIGDLFRVVAEHGEPAPQQNDDRAELEAFRAEAAQRQAEDGQRELAHAEAQARTEARAWVGGGA